jgi:hypothetical protein
MDSVATIKSRYGQIRTLWKVSDNVYHLKGESYYTRSSYGPDSSMIDFEGGPCICSGQKLSPQFEIEDQREIVSVQWIDAEIPTAEIVMSCNTQH